MIVVTGMPRPGPGLSIQGRLEYAMILTTATGGSLQQLHLDWAPEHSPRLHTHIRVALVIYRTGALFGHGDMAFILAGGSPLVKRRH